MAIQQKSKAPPKLFTRDEAQKMLPLVRVIVQDIVEQYRSFKDRVASLQSLQPKRDLVPARQREAMEEDIETRRDHINTAVAELGELGVELKDLEKGLVDFPSRRGDDVVYLCWQLGEPGIEFWHTVESGFNGRQAIGTAD